MNALNALNAPNACVPDPLADDDARYAAVARRDRACDGRFFYAVRTTGVFCRPSCAARLARRENVSFHATAQDAARAGFRPCKRCRPTGADPQARHAASVTRACRLIEQAEEPPRLADLAAAAGLSPFHFHRVFKAITGVTPKAYAAAHRAQRLRQGLAAGSSVTAATYDAGFGASSRLYAAAGPRLGMTPSAFRAGGRGASIRFAVGACSLGAVLVAATDVGICAIEFGDDADALLRGLQDRFPKARLIGADPAFEALVAQVVGMVERPREAAALPLDIGGTAFQQRVWAALRAIPAGSTASYAEIAARIGSPGAARAVGRACAGNVLAVAIPCHRVVRADGDLSGYRWGIERKGRLLAREAA